MIAKKVLHVLLVYVLVAMLLIPMPLWAAGVVADPNAPGGKRPGVGSAQNGVPMVNITAPNQSGLSHNQYHDFNVGKPGLILNNSDRMSNTQQGGLIQGNPNLAGKAPARTILNEVTSQNRSHIQGYMEVAGQRADVILANPNGVTINGGGFINTDRATITTGKPRLDAQGNLDRFEVRQGMVTVEGAGINASNTSAFDIISRAATINAEIHARELNVIAGENAYDPAKGTVTPLASGGTDVPAVAIDSSALGGMYAGRITLISSEKGVGVNLDGLVQAQNNLMIDSQGKLTLREVRSGGDMALRTGDSLEVRELAGAERDFQVAAKSMTLTNAELSAGRDMAVQVEDLTLTREAQVKAGNNIRLQGNTVRVEDHASVQADASLGIVADKVQMSNAELLAGKDLLLAASDMTLDKGTSVLSQARLEADADTLKVQGGATLYAETAIVQAENLALEGGASLGADNLAVQATSVDVDAASALVSGADMVVRADNMTNRGLVYSAGNFYAFIRNKLSNLDGADLLAQGDMEFYGVTETSRMGQLHNQASSIESLDGSIAINADLFFNDGGKPTVKIVDLAKEYDIIGWYGDPTIPRADNTWDYTDDTGSPSSLKYGYLPDGRRNYMTMRFQLNKAPGHVAAFLRQQEEKYGIVAERIGKSEGLQEWREFSVEVVDKAATPASLMAGKNVVFNVGELRNTYSFISAGENMAISADKLVNQALELSNILKVHRQLVGTGPSGTRILAEIFQKDYEARTLADIVPSVIAAAGTLLISVKEEFNNDTVKGGSDYAGKSGGTPAFDGYEVTGNISLGDLLEGELSAINIIKPGGVFRPVSDPAHPYLIESDPRMTDLGHFYGSEYFFSLLGIDQDNLQQKLLGDAFYETRMIRDQLMARAGTRYLFPGVENDAETMRLLMENAAAEGSALGLSVGTALTADQVAALSKDIVWLEEQEYMGETVLVPRLYLANSTLADLDTRGAMIGGDTVVMEFAGNMTNEGQIKGNNVQLASSSDILNRGGDIIGKNALVVSADGSILNQSGSLSGGDISLAAGKDIVLETLFGSKANGHGSDATMGQVAEVKATGNLSMVAGNNVVLKAAQTGSDGTTTIAAGNDVVLGAQEAAFTNSYSFKSVTGYSNMSGYMGSSVTGQDVTVVAGRDVTLSASGIGAENNAIIQAGRNVSLEAKSGGSEYYSHETRKGGGMFGGGSWSRTQARSESGLVSSGIVAGNDISIAAGSSSQRGNVSLQAASVAGGGNVNIGASGDITVAAGQESSSSYFHSSSKGFMSSKAEERKSASTTSVGSTIVGNNVILQAGDNVLVSGSAVVAENDLLASADKGDVVVSSAQESSSYSYAKKESGFGLSFGGGGVSIWEGSAEKGSGSRLTNAGSALSAGNNMKLDAGRDVTVIGSSVSAGNDLGLYAGRDVNLLPGKESSSSSYASKKESVGISFNQSGFGANIFAGYSSTEKGMNSQGSYSAASLVEGGNDVIIQAGRDVNQVGSHITAGQDLMLDAGRDWNMMASYDHESLDSYVKQVQMGITASAGANAADRIAALGDFPSRMDNGRGGLGYSAITAGSAVLRAVDDIKSGLSQYASASVTAGTSYSKTESRQSSSSANPSTVMAGRDVVASSGRDIVIEGGKILGGQDVMLGVGRDLTIVSAQSSSSSSMSSSSMGGGIGLGASIGTSGTAAGITANAHASGAKASGSDIVHDNALIIAGDVLSVTSGRDTTLAGANLEGDRVWMDVGGDLTVASVQDKSESKNSSWSAGGSVTVGMGVSASGSISGSKGSSSSNWTGEQTSIIGRGEVDIYVEDNTHLSGGLIAADNGNLRVDTGTLTYEEVNDSRKSSQVGGGISGSVSWSPKKPELTQEEKAALEAEREAIKNEIDENNKYLAENADRILDSTEGEIIAPGASDNPFDATPGAVEGQYASSSQSGVLRPTIGAGSVIVRDDPDASLSGLNRDVNQAREIGQKEGTNLDLYVSPEAIKELMRYKEMAEQHNDYMANFLPGLGINESATGKDSRQTWDDLEQKFENREPLYTGETGFASDQNPFLKMLYHIVPGFKAFSEIHDIQMKELELKYGNGKMPTELPVTSIPASFFNSLIYAVGSTLDVTSWGSNWRDYIKPSFNSRIEYKEENDIAISRGGEK